MNESILTKFKNFISFDNCNSNNKRQKMLPCSSFKNGYFCNNRNKPSSFVLFLSAMIIINLCPFNSDYSQPPVLKVEKETNSCTKSSSSSLNKMSPQVDVKSGSYLRQLEACIKYLRLMLLKPIQLSRRTTTSMQAEAKVLSKMAKMWYIKKKIKKLGKKLKKHTIAVPVFTAIPIYEHPYYPPHHIPHVAAPIAMHHHHAAAAAAASSYSPVVVSQMAAAAALAAAAQQQQHSHQQHHHIASASSPQQQVVGAYRVPTAAAQVHTQQQQQQQQQQTQSHHHHNQPTPSAHLQPAASLIHHVPAANQIINAYVPSPPLYVDELGSLYGHFANAYGRYDGGYQLW